MKVQVTPHGEAPWFVEFRFPYNKKAVEDLRRIPGCRWHAENVCWLVPVEVYELIKQKRITIGERT